MAMFPPAPPDNIPEMRPGPTSGFFQRQERAFFAQAGKEIVRVRVDVDLSQNNEDPMKPRPSSSTRSWANGPAGHSPIQASPTSMPYPHPSSRPRVNPGPVPLYPVPSHTPPNIPPSAHPPPPHPPSNGVRTPPHDLLPPALSKPEYPSEDFSADESWRRPTPYGERRRAGKHTKRVLRT
jgi:hypothetical protein